MACNLKTFLVLYSVRAMVSLSKTYLLSHRVSTTSGIFATSSLATFHCLLIPALHSSPRYGQIQFSVVMQRPMCCHSGLIHYEEFRFFHPKAEQKTTTKKSWPSDSVLSSPSLLQHPHPSVFVCLFICLFLHAGDRSSVSGRPRRVHREARHREYPQHETQPSPLQT